MDIFAFLEQLKAEGTIDEMALNSIAQFGREPRNYLGATILPERRVPRNMFKESDVRYRTVIASDGERYSPAQKREGGRLVGTFTVELGNSDIAREFTGQDYDALIEHLGANNSMEAAASLIGWTDSSINLALVELNEKQRWDALVDAQVVRKGDNGYTETVQYPDPSGHRSAAAGVWTDDTYDPWDDIMGKVETLSDKGYSVNRIITSTKVVSTLLRNQQIARRSGATMVIPTDTGDQEFTRRNTRQQLNLLAQADGLPGFETYDAHYWDEDGRHRFLPEDVMVFVATTGRDEVVENTIEPENRRYINDTLGYHAVGRPVGQTRSGRVIKLRPYPDTKPPRIEAEGWQTSLPVITEPEAVAVITGIALG